MTPSQTRNPSLEQRTPATRESAESPVTEDYVLQEVKERWPTVYERERVFARSSEVLWFPGDKVASVGFSDMHLAIRLKDGRVIRLWYR